MPCKARIFFVTLGGGIHKQEMVSMIKVILAALVDNPHEIIFDSYRIRKNLVYLTKNQRRLIFSVVDTESKRFR